MTISPNLTNEGSHIAELFPDVAAVAAVYGDESGRYAEFLQLGAPQYTKQPYYFWYQLRPTNTTSTAPPPTSTVSSSSKNLSLLAFVRLFLLLDMIQGLLPLVLLWLFLFPHSVIRRQYVVRFSYRASTTANVYTSGWPGDNLYLYLYIL